MTSGITGDVTPPPAPTWGAASGIDEVVEVSRWDFLAGESPSDDSYSRVSDPGRYRSLHAFALALLDDLEAEFEVSRDEGLELAGGMDTGVSVVRAIRLTPDMEGAASVTVCLTDFPGLMVRFGSSAAVPFPFCGCDACDELVQDVVESLRDRVDAVVSGGFAEYAHGEASFVTVRGSSGPGDPSGTPIMHSAWSPRIETPPK
ncbi:DUF6226 family protein [Leifsonia flava]|uniref:Uncharacterized protein n=1 Tax=Orlajensenia leifsoniae TaxID=2561933 RepID=A0A4Y9QWG5_9MICO|nr:DUF6226 family protein [Leifsonia flava]TFV95305.1 hypothetical protein E4M00_14740 [Leifsonia flava]